MLRRVAARASRSSGAPRADLGARGAPRLLAHAVVTIMMALQCNASAASEPLRVCMAEENPPLSRLANGTMTGLDLRIAREVAAVLRRELVVVPFDTTYEKESSLAHEVNALLSSGVCEATSGFPLLAGDLGPPSRASSRTADYPGAPRKRERPFVPLKPLSPTRAYQGVAIGAAMRAPADSWSSLTALSERPHWRVGAVSGTMAGTVALMWRHGALRSQLVSLSHGESALDALAAGRLDVALVPIAQFDGWRLAHARPSLTLAGWRKPIDVNLGFVTLASNESLRNAIDAVISSALADGRLEGWATAEGATWLPPRTPDVSNGPTLVQLVAD